MFATSNNTYTFCHSNSRIVYLSYFLLAIKRRVHVLGLVSYGWSAVMQWIWTLFFSDLTPILLWLEELSNRLTTIKEVTGLYPNLNISFGNVMLKMIVNWLNLYMKNIWKEAWRNTYVKALETGEDQNHKEIQIKIQTELPLFKSWEYSVSTLAIFKACWPKWLQHPFSESLYLLSVCTCSNSPAGKSKCFAWRKVPHLSQERRRQTQNYFFYCWNEKHLPMQKQCQVTQYKAKKDQTLGSRPRYSQLS